MQVKCLNYEVTKKTTDCDITNTKKKYITNQNEQMKNKHVVLFYVFSDLRSEVNIRFVDCGSSLLTITFYTKKYQIESNT